MITTRAAYPGYPWHQAIKTKGAMPLMHQTLRFAILLIAACFGCSDRQNAPTTTTNTTPLVTRPPESGTSPATAPPQDSNGQNPDHPDAPSPDGQVEYVSFPLAGVKLIRPTGFDDAESFRGFEHASSHSTIMIARTPGPFSVTGSYTAEQLAMHGMTLRSKENATVDGEAGVLFHVTQEGNGQEFAKWILAFGNKGDTILVTAAFPKSPDATLSNQLKACLLGTKLDALASPAGLPDVGFTIAPPEKLKYAERSAALGKVLLYSKGGVVPSKSPDDPIFLAAPSLYKVPIDNPKQFAEQRLIQTGSTKDLSIRFSGEITIDGLSGFEIFAVGQFEKTSVPLHLYQVILYDEGAYILMQGLVRARESEEYLPEFKAMARSLTRTPK